MRAQAHTLEGVVAGLVLLSGVAFALQATAVTPLTASTSNQHIENQQRAVASDLLAAAAENETLRPTLLYWDSENESFVGADTDGTYANGGPPTTFGNALNETFGADRIAFNVDVVTRTTAGDRSRTRLVSMGMASDNAVTATRPVPVYDDDPLADGTGTVSEAAESGDFYADDADPDGPLFNVMEVRITVWRI